MSGMIAALKLRTTIKPAPQTDRERQILCGGVWRPGRRVLGVRAGALLATVYSSPQWSFPRFKRNRDRGIHHLIMMPACERPGEPVHARRKTFKQEGAGAVSVVIFGRWWSCQWIWAEGGKEPVTSTS